MDRRRVRGGLLLGGFPIILMLAAAAPAPDAPVRGVTLAHIAETHTVTLGVREDARPFAYVLPNGQPGGFAVDICHELVKDISDALGGIDLKIAYRPVTTETRIERVVSGAIDMECGSTTRTEQRLHLVSFSPTFYISGVKLLVPHGSPIRSYRELQERTVAVTAGTTGEAVMHTLADRLLIRMNFVTFPGNEKAFTALREGRANAFATDAILLAGLAASSEGHGFDVVGDTLSNEPYGLMYRRGDPEFAAIIEAGFRRLATQRRLAAIYHRWMQEPLPSGDTLRVPMSAELVRIYRGLGQPN